MNNVPFVSVIVPVYNGANQITTCLKALVEQNYEKEKYEIIVIDNGSSDNTQQIVKQFPVNLLIENKTQGSYAARNLGIRNARGDIFAFTDADCTPCDNWIMEGVSSIKTHNADLSGGNVCFSFTKNATGAEVWDSISNMQIEQNICDRGVAKTANLFIYKKVFDHIGNFPHYIKSGGDIAFTKKATQAGYKLIFAPAAQVSHPARKLGALLKKQVRVGIGQMSIRKQIKIKKRDFLNRLVHNFIPPSAGYINRKLTAKSLYLTKVMRLRVWAASYLAKIATGAGNIAALFKRRTPLNED